MEQKRHKRHFSIEINKQRINKCSSTRVVDHAHNNHDHDSKKKKKKKNDDDELRFKR